MHLTAVFIDRTTTLHVHVFFCFFSSQIFPDPSDFERCCKLKDRLPSIVVEATEGEVESGELRWPPEEFIVSEEEDEKRDEKVQNAQMHETPH